MNLQCFVFLQSIPFVTYSALTVMVHLTYIYVILPCQLPLCINVVCGLESFPQDSYSSMSFILQLSIRSLCRCFGNLVSFMLDLLTSLIHMHLMYQCILRFVSLLQAYHCYLLKCQISSGPHGPIFMLYILVIV